MIGVILLLIVLTTVVFPIIVFGIELLIVVLLPVGEDDRPLVLVSGAVLPKQLWPPLRWSGRPG